MFAGAYPVSYQRWMDFALCNIDGVPNIFLHVAVPE